MVEKRALIRICAGLVMLIALPSCSSKDKAGSDPDLGRASEETVASAPDAGGQSCLSTDEVGTLVGFAVRSMPDNRPSHGSVFMCRYVDGKSDAGATILISYGPPTQVDSILESIKPGSRLLSGQNGGSETIAAGDGGHAYGSATKSEAAASSGGRFYHVEIIAGNAGIGNKKDAAIELLRRIIIMAG